MMMILILMILMIIQQMMIMTSLSIMILTRMPWASSFVVSYYIMSFPKRYPIPLSLALYFSSLNMSRKNAKKQQQQRSSFARIPCAQ